VAAVADDLLILSASSRIRTAAPLNHRIYADRIGVPYVFDSAPSTVDRIYLHKIDALRRVLPRAEWVFWIDDDAFFTDLSIDLRRFIDDVGDVDVVFCRSPINPRGGWTWMSAGQFFLRRSDATVDLLRAVASTDLEAVRAWWDPEVYGLFTNGDQDALVYQLMGPDGDRWKDRFVQLPWEAFNSRPYHYEARLDEHFICHFAVPGGRPKADVVAEFATRLGTTNALCDAALIEPYRVFLQRSELGPFVGIGPPRPKGPKAPPAKANVLRRIARRARRSLRR
jgi:galactosyl transferase GMA12/MNN10 family